MAKTKFNFGDYSVKNIKSFVGMEGYGFNATLYRAGKRVAFVIDDAHGGEVDIQWDRKVDSKAERDLLDAHLKTIPIQHEFDTDLEVDAGWFISDLVGATQEEAQLRRWCKTKTIVKLKDSAEGTYMTLSAPYSLKVLDFISKKYAGNVAEIINLRFQKMDSPMLYKV